MCIERTIDDVLSCRCYQWFTLLIDDVFCWCLLEQEAGHVVDVTGMNRILLLIWEHASKYIEVCTLVIGLRAL